MAITTTIRASLPWAKGPAIYRDGQVVMQIDAYAPKYTADVAQGIDTELSRISNPSDAVEFVRRFGLLNGGVYWPADEYGPFQHTTAPDAIPLEAAEPYELFAATAAELREVIQVTKITRTAVTTNDSDAIDWLRRWAAEEWTRRTGRYLAGEDLARHVHTRIAEPTFLRDVTGTVASKLDEGINGADDVPVTRSTLHVVGPQMPSDPREAPDRLQLRLYAPTLRAFIYWCLSQKLITRAPIVSCPGCSHDFIRAHSAQTYCTKNCARRARYRASQQEKTAPRQGVN